jgi:hypothetical protein
VTDWSLETKEKERRKTQWADNRMIYNEPDQQWPFSEDYIYIYNIGINPSLNEPTVGINSNNSKEPHNESIATVGISTR